jgi:hypothetical protein
LALRGLPALAGSTRSRSARSPCGTPSPAAPCPPRWS